MNKYNSLEKNDSATEGGTLQHPAYAVVEWTFQHHQDGKRLQLVPAVVNKDVRHCSGSSIAKKKGNLNFPEPNEVSKCKTGCNESLFKKNGIK